jgi:hypothetical protein
MNSDGLPSQPANSGYGGHHQSNEEEEVFEFLPGVASLMEDLDSE